jgi:hypothetical protein
VLTTIADDSIGFIDLYVFLVIVIWHILKGNVIFRELKLRTMRSDIMVRGFIRTRKRWRRNTRVN